MEQVLNKIFFKIEKSYDEINFYCSDGYLYTMKHYQDCCESVTIDTIDGDLDDLIGSKILMAECESKDGEDDGSGYSESSTWTFYKFATIKGYVTIRWYGSSNGYYSEGVSFDRSEENYKDEWRDFIIEDILK
jgi:hypothetical protein